MLSLMPQNKQQIWRWEPCFLLTHSETHTSPLKRCHINTQKHQTFTLCRSATLCNLSFPFEMNSSEVHRGNIHIKPSTDAAEQNSQASKISLAAGHPSMPLYICLLRNSAKSCWITTSVLFLCFRTIGLGSNMQIDAGGNSAVQHPL